MRSSYVLVIILAVLSLLMASSSVFAQIPDEYVTLKKFLNARMYGEAYNEILRHEITKDKLGAELQKLRVNLLEQTKEQMLKQAKVNPDDPAIFTILADIAFQQSDFDNAMIYISKALAIKSGPMSNYVCAKILFNRGNIDQAFDRMGNVLESMPDSQVVFEDFQFLYSCKNYGRATATKICKNSGFLRRATPSVESKGPQVPVSPFANDPTKVAQTKNKYPSEPIYDDEDEDDGGVLPDEITSNHVTEPDDMEDPFSDFDTLLSDDVVAESTLPDPMDLNTTKSEDLTPEEIVSLKQAEVLAEKALIAFENHDYQLARDEYAAALVVYPRLADTQGVKAKIDKHFSIIDKYSEAVDYFEMSSFERAKPLFEEVYAHNPDKYRAAAYYLGRIYLVQEEPDYDKVIAYFDVVINDKTIDEEFARETKWVKLQVLYEKGDFEQANEMLKYFEKTHMAFIKNKERYNELYYGINYYMYRTIIWVIMLALCGMFVAVTVLGSMSHSIFQPKDPVLLIEKAYKNRKYKRAVSIGEKAIARGQPIQIEREILEILVKVYFDIKNYNKCQEAARKILEKFPENNVAWGYLASTSMATNDTSNEAIALYENIYRENPAKIEYLPMLAKHYIKTKDTSPDAMEILQAYYKMSNADPEAVVALANGYVLTKALSNEAIKVLEAANKIKPRIEYKELLARNYAKNADYEKAATTCIEVLAANIDNMGIHVVYTTSMKKLGKIDVAIAQYNTFLVRFPNKPQLFEIINGLTNDLNDLGPQDSALPDLLDLPVELPEADLPVPGADFDMDESGGLEPAAVPLPDFLRENYESETPEVKTQTNDALPTFDSIKQAFSSVQLEQKTPVGLAENIENSEDTPKDTESLPTLDPFSMSDSFLDEFASTLPPEFGNTSEEQPPAKPTEQTIDTREPIASILPIQSERKTTEFEEQEKLFIAHEALEAKDPDLAIEALSHEFASTRNKEMGIMLIDAWLAKKNPIAAYELLEVLELDPEILPENIKDALYRIGTALEQDKKYKEALKVYDLICNVDINYKDAFDRSDKLYSKTK